MEYTTKDAAHKYKKKRTVYFIIGFTLLAICLLLVFLPGEGEQATAAVFVIPAVFIVLGIICHVRSKNEEYLEVYCRKKNEKANEKANLKKESLLKTLPDFEPSKTFEMANGQKIWISQPSKLLQFLLFAENQKEIRLKNKFEKSKILPMSKLKDIKLFNDTEQVRRYNTYGAHSSSIGVASADVTEKTVDHWYMNFLFDDMDCPVVHLWFGEDGITPLRIKETIEIIMGNETNR